jgi:hypothetical protein
MESAACPQCPAFFWNQKIDTDVAITSPTLVEAFTYRTTSEYRLANERNSKSDGEEELPYLPGACHVTFRMRDIWVCPPQISTFKRG